MNNKIRYKSMKKSSPVTQYKRYLLGEHYCYGFRTLSPMPIPKTIRDMIVEAIFNFNNIVGVQCYNCTDM